MVELVERGLGCGNEFPRCHSKSAEADCARVGFGPTCGKAEPAREFIRCAAGMAEVVGCGRSSEKGS